MNGLELIDLKPTGFVANLLGLRPKENAFLEIHNFLKDLFIQENGQSLSSGQGGPLDAGIS